jgi:hypothetical protein
MAPNLLLLRDVLLFFNLEIDSAQQIYLKSNYSILLLKAKKWSVPKPISQIIDSHDQK